MEPMERKFIAPPALLGRVILFIAHYEIVKETREPTVIVGPTGVGKSLFLHLFKKLYREEFDDGKTHPIIEANCAHFGGQHSDPNIARGELFGWEKGVHSLAKEQKQGLLESANGGIIILEELGELPREVQAMLLTFIETGVFRRMGGTKDIHVTAQIIGATNNEENLRRDFYHRLLPFHVTPLFRRRTDILYYMHQESPELVSSLTPTEALMVLAHNWPGNVREVIRIVRLLKRRRKAVEIIGMKFDLDTDRFLSFEDKDTSLGSYRLRSLFDALRRNGVDVDSLESLLSTYGVGIDISNTQPSFSNLPSTLKEGFFPEMDERFDIGTIEPVEQFEKAYEGYRIFCSLFFQDANADQHVLDIRWGTSIENDLERVPEKYRAKSERLARSILSYLSGIDLPDNMNLPIEHGERQRFFLKLLEDYPRNGYLSSLMDSNEWSSPKTTEDRSFNDIFTMTRDELLKMYYEGLLQRTAGNVSAAARQARMSLTNYRQQLEKAAIPFRRNPQNTG
jgi:DNA-binding NtrC family response regulator